MGIGLAFPLISTYSLYREAKRVEENYKIDDTFKNTTFKKEERVYTPKNLKDANGISASKFYDSCAERDLLLGKTWLFSEARIIMGIALVILSSNPIVGACGVAIALEGLAHHAYSLLQMRQWKWHANYKNNDDELGLLYHQRIGIDFTAVLGSLFASNNTKLKPQVE